MKRSFRPPAWFVSGDRAAYLITGFLREELTDEEREELDDWISASDENMHLFEKATDESLLDDYLRWYSERDVEARLREVKQRIQLADSSPRLLTLQRLAAACIVLLIGLGIFAYLYFRPAPPEAIADLPAHDLPPGTNRAQLKLANGRIILLEGLQDSILSSHLRIHDGLIEYNAAEPVAAWHEVTVPEKGSYQLRLADGTRVFLNANSSIRYPTAFTEKERRVEVTGETYFEVTHDAKQPFIVLANGIETADLGTAFNINAYSNEPAVKITLVEGAVRVRKGQKIKDLVPRQQLSVTTDAWKVTTVDTDPITAWTCNEFQLKDTKIEEVMRMITRWYGAEVIFEDKINYHFNGRINRSVPLSELLHLLEATGHVRFSVDNHIITVKDQGN